MQVVPTSCFKSMTWVIETQNSDTSTKVAVINMKVCIYNYVAPTLQVEGVFNLTKTPTRY